MARVLVVDDEPDIAKLVRITLEMDGHEVTVASDGQSALDLVDENAYDAVLLDLTMPGMDGFDVLTALKSDPEPSTASIPVILLTARSDQMDRIRGGIEGAAFYLTKPFSGSDLRAHLGRALQDGAEPELRRAAQRAALEQLARIERAELQGGEDVLEGQARPRLTRLDHPPEPRRTAPGPAQIDAEAVASLSDKQRELLRVVRQTPTVQQAAAELGVSRSNVYASLRRIARRLSVPSVPELVSVARQGAVPGLAES
ncbi:MAG TPA: response regulator [Acidimicrobiales bacterium]|nr:response regulator [Acidimicrobiales bacterium]